MKKIKIDVGKTLVIGAAAFQAYQFGRALNVYDGDGWNIGSVNIGGLILGLIVNVAVAWAATQLPSIKGKGRTRSAWISFFALMILSPALVAPALWMLFQSLPIGNWKLFLAIGLSVAPDLTIALSGFVAGKSLIPLPEVDEDLPKEKKDKGKKDKNLPEVTATLPLQKRKRITNEELLAYLAENPGETHEQVAKHFNVTRQAIGSRIKAVYAVNLEKD